MIGAICSAVHQKDEKYYFFDSHSHNMSALSGADGTSVMIRFSNMDDLVSYLYAFYQSMHISLMFFQFQLLVHEHHQLVISFQDIFQIS